jgi:hypothetical protein
MSMVPQERRSSVASPAEPYDPPSSSMSRQIRSGGKSVGDTLQVLWRGSDDV